MQNKFPYLTKEEWTFFKRNEVEFFGRYNLTLAMPLVRRVGSSLHTLAVNKLHGAGGFEINKEEAIEHHLKACRFWPHYYDMIEFRKRAGLMLTTWC